MPLGCARRIMEALAMPAAHRKLADRLFAGKNQ
jgi:hypothetical protein